MLADPHSSWSLEPELGLTLKKVMISNTGNYRCVGTMDNITDEKHFTISVKGTLHTHAKGLIIQLAN